MEGGVPVAHQRHQTENGKDIVVYRNCCMGRNQQRDGHSSFVLTALMGLQQMNVIYFDEKGCPQTEDWKNIFQQHSVPSSQSRPEGNLSYPKEIINEDEGTVSMWVHAKDGNSYSTPSPLYSTGIDSGLGTFDFLIKEGLSPYIRFYGSDNLSTQLRPTNFEFDKWQHIIVTWKKSEYFKCYIDGYLSVESLTPVDWTGASENFKGFYLGSGIRNNPHIIIDEVRIESRAISEEEVKAWATSGLHYNYLDYSMFAE